MIEKGKLLIAIVLGASTSLAGMLALGYPSTEIMLMLVAAGVEVAF